MKSNKVLTAPPILDIQTSGQPLVEKVTCSNGVSMQIINAGIQEVIKLELVFRAGRTHEHKRMVAKATAELLKEGCRGLNSFEIAEQLDFYGASLRTRSGMDFINITLYCLSKHIDPLLDLLQNVIKHPTFPNEELNRYRLKNIQSLEENLAKNEILAYRKITEKMFGNLHPYGYNSSIEDYVALTREDLVKHYDDWIGNKGFEVILSGKLDTAIIEKIQACIGQDPVQKVERKVVPVISFPEIERLDILGKQKLQASICVGRRLFTRKHEDFIAMYVLNTLLGGFFGSRLMSNIREDKGYTYNIYSMMDCMLQDGFFYISTDLDMENVEACLVEISKEFDRLKEEEIEKEELLLLRNYLKGSILRFMDGPFNQHDAEKLIKLHELPSDFIQQLGKGISNLTASELKNVAKKYLNIEDMYIVVVK